MEPVIVNLTAGSSATHDFRLLVMFGFIAVTIIVHIMVALGVMKDALAVQRQGTRLMFFGSLGWTFLAMMTGLFGLIAYWLMHHSSFRHSVPGEE